MLTSLAHRRCFPLCVRINLWTFVSERMCFGWTRNIMFLLSTPPPQKKRSAEWRLVSPKSQTSWIWTFDFPRRDKSLACSLESICQTFALLTSKKREKKQKTKMMSSLMSSSARLASTSTARWACVPQQCLDIVGVVIECRVCASAC